MEKQITEAYENIQLLMAQRRAEQRYFGHNKLETIGKLCRGLLKLKSLVEGKRQTKPGSEKKPSTGKVVLGFEANNGNK